MQKENKKIILFLAKFFALFFICYGLLFAANPIGVESGIAQFEAGLIGAQSSENKIAIGEKIFVINESCTGLVSVAILFAIVFALRKPELASKIRIFIAGAIVLMLLNLARVYIVLYAAINFGFADADFLHSITWVATAAIILALWYFATKKISKVEKFNELI